MCVPQLTIESGIVVTAASSQIQFEATKHNAAFIQEQVLYIQQDSRAVDNGAHGQGYVFSIQIMLWRPIAIKHCVRNQ